MRRNYKVNKIACIEMYLIYQKYGFKAASRYADKVFGVSETSNWALKRKFELYPKGGWKKDWLTSMYRDINVILKKYSVIE